MVLSASFAVFAAESPLDSRSIALGSDLAMFQENPRFECKASGKPVADHICNLALGQSANIGAVPVTQMLLYFYDGKLQAIGLFFGAQHFPEVDAKLVEGYGPGATRHQELKNAKGDTLDNIIRTWRQGQTTLELSRYAGRRSLSRLTYHTDYAIEEYKRRSKGQARSRTP
jgi:hypothetical protein